MENNKKKQKGIKSQTHRMMRFTIFTSGLLIFMLIAGCGSQMQEATETSITTEPTITECTTKECFVSAANECHDISVTLTEDAGVFTYSSSTDCVFTKTLVSLDASETQEMKNLLEGKSLTCTYEIGSFDERWVSSLIFGSEYCEGELKDILVELLAFL